MALSLRLRRAIPLTSSITNHHKALSSIVSFPEPLPSLSSPILAPQNPNLNPKIPFQSRGFRSSSILLSSRSPRTSSNFDSETIGPDDILFEGCDYNHWLITMDFPKDPRPSAEEMVETYVQTATAVLGSREEAMKKIYACSTTTYQGFQVQVSEEVSEKFRALPGVVFILPDSYIDPVNKEYGGDKYDNGVITHRPPPVLHSRQGRYGDRNRENRDYNRPPGGPMQQQPPWQQQNYQNPPQRPMQQGPPPHQNYQNPPRGPMQQGPPPQQNYQNPPRGPMQQGSPPQQNYQNPPRGPMQQGPPPLQNYQNPPRGPMQQGPPPLQNYQNPPRGPMQQGPPPQQNYQNPPRGPMQQGPQQQQNYQNPRMNNVPEGQGNYQVDRSGPVPPYQGNYNQGDRRDFYPPGQRDFQPLDRMNNAPSVPPVGISGKGWGGNPGQGVEGNYGQISGENYKQETTSNHRQGGSRTYEPGLGGAHGRDVGSGSSHGSTGYGENPSFQQVEQRDFMQGLHENQTNNWGSTSKP